MRIVISIFLIFGLAGGFGVLAEYSDATRPSPGKSPSTEFLAVLFKKGRPRGGDSIFDSVTDVGYSKFALKHNAEIINRLTNFKFHVVGASDPYECGVEGCSSLSRRRAQLVHQWLLANGVSSAAMKIPLDVGNSRPLTNNSNEEARALNRRAWVELFPVEE